MKKTLAFLTLLLVPGVLAPVTATASETPPPPAGSTDSLLLVREAWIVFVEEPSGYLQGAYEAFLKNDGEKAQELLRKAGAFLFMQARWADTELRRELEDSLKELNGIIVDLDGEAAVTAAELRAAFARAEYRLALSHLLFAADLVEQKSYGTAGYALDAAAAHLLFAALWTDEGLDSGDAVKARRARSLAAALREGVEEAAGKAKGALKDLGRGMNGLAKALKLPQAPLPPELNE